jgi:hypothetical protein
MFKRPIVVSALVACAAFAAPAGADAATLAPNKPCYGGGDGLVLLGAGYTPGAQVTIAANGAPLSPPVTAGAPGSAAPGTIAAALATPFLTSSTERTDTFTATDSANTANVGTTGVRRSILRVVVRPANASPYRSRRFKARGFTAGNTLYRHVVRGHSVSNSRQGRLRGACHTLSYKRRLFRRTAKTGTYRVQFDTKRSYSSKTAQRVRFRVRVFRTVRRSSASAAGASAAGAAESWTQVN